MVTVLWGEKMSKHYTIVIFAALLVMAIHQSGSALAEDRSSTGPTSQTLVVMDAPANFSGAAGRLGFSNIERVSLDALSIVTYRVSVPAGLSIGGAIRQLRRAFPDIVVETDQWGG